MEKAIILLCLILFALNSCKDNRNNSQKMNEKIDTYLFSKEVINKGPQMINLSDIYSEITGFSLDLNGGPIGHVSKVLIFDDILFVFDSHYAKKIFAYDLRNEGKFMYSIGAKGKGPGEFIHLTDFTIDKKNHQILAIDWTQKRITYFDLHGNYIKSKTLDFIPVRIFSDAGLLYFLRDAREDECCLIITDEGFKKRKEYLPYSYYPSFTYFDSGFQKAGNNLLLNYPNCDTIFKLKDEKIIPHFAIETGKHSFYACVFNNEITNRRDLSKAFKGYRHRQNNLYEDVLIPGIYFEDDKLKCFEFGFNQKSYYLFKIKSLNDSTIIGSINNDFFYSYISLVGYNNEYGTVGIVSTESMLYANINQSIEKKLCISEDLLLSIKNFKHNNNPFIIFLN